MYFPYFIAYIAIGLTISLVVFFWAVKSGQFRDQQRARFIPLRDVADDMPAPQSRAARWEVYALFGLAIAGLSASAAVLLYAVYFSK
jgi:cbb3-type cytochrome oxidase maturation protein